MPSSRDLPGRLGQLGGLAARRPRGLPHGRALRRLAAQLHHLLVALAARPRAGDVAGRETRQERDACAHMEPLSRALVMCTHDLPP